MGSVIVDQYDNVNFKLSSSYEKNNFNLWVQIKCQLDNKLCLGAAIISGRSFEFNSTGNMQQFEWINVNTNSLGDNNVANNVISCSYSKCTLSSFSSIYYFE